jgi:predicted ATPase
MTYRSEEVDAVLDHFLAEIGRQRLATEVTLGTLTRAEVDVMVRSIFGLQRSVRRDFLEPLYQRTEGNPFFVEEILKSWMSTEGRPTDAEQPDRGPWPSPAIPRTVQDAVRQRVMRLSSSARHLLELAATAGQRFNLTLLQRLVDESPTSLTKQRLLSAQLVEEESKERFRQACLHAKLLFRAAGPSDASCTVASRKKSRRARTRLQASSDRLPTSPSFLRG